jgi:hypothetical protein
MKYRVTLLSGTCSSGIHCFGDFLPGSFNVSPLTSLQTGQFSDNLNGTGSGPIEGEGESPNKLRLCKTSLSWRHDSQFGRVDEQPTYRCRENVSYEVGLFITRATTVESYTDRIE